MYQIVTRSVWHQSWTSRSFSASGTGIEATFRHAVEALEKSKAPAKPVSNETKLRLYAYFKQAEKGPCTGARPGMFDMINRAKYDAWKTLGDMPKEKAMEGYIQGVKDIFDGTLPAVSATATTNSTASSSTAPATPPTAPTEEKIHLRDFEELFARPVPAEHTANVAKQLTRMQLQLSEQAGTATISLNRPKKGNAFDLAMWEELRHCWEAVSGDKHVKVVILRGDNNTFTTGMDLSVFINLQAKLSVIECEGRRRESLKQFIHYLQSVVTAAEACTVPVIAAISGHCIGAGIDLICATDLRYATKSAQFSVKEIDLAIVADMGTVQRLPKLVGQQRATELCLTGRTFTGEEAEAMGLVLKAFDTEEAMMKHVIEVAEQIGKKSPLTVRGVKRSLIYTRDHTVADGLEQVQLWNSAMILSNDLLTAATAVMSKTEPVFKEL